MAKLMLRPYSSHLTERLMGKMPGQGWRSLSLSWQSLDDKVSDRYLDVMVLNSY
jgi:hypothetical protein